MTWSGPCSSCRPSIISDFLWVTGKRVYGDWRTRRVDPRVGQTVGDRSQEGIALNNGCRCHWVVFLRFECLDDVYGTSFSLASHPQVDPALCATRSPGAGNTNPRGDLAGSLRGQSCGQVGRCGKPLWVSEVDRAAPPFTGLTGGDGRGRPSPPTRRR
jgi:hypothetical protein